MRQRGPAARQTKVLAVICDAMARHVALMQTPGPWAPGAIPTVDFLLHWFRVVVKKMGVKSQHGPGDGAVPTRQNRARPRRNAVSLGAWDFGIGQSLRCAENSVIHL